MGIMTPLMNLASGPHRNAENALDFWTFFNFELTNDTGDILNLHDVLALANQWIRLGQGVQRFIPLSRRRCPGEKVLYLNLV